MTACFAATSVAVGADCSPRVRGGLLLARPHRRVDAAARKQLAVVAALDDAAGFEHQDLVGVDDRRQPVRDDQRGAVGRDLGEARLDLALGLGVERRGRLVEDQDRAAPSG